MLNLAGSHAQFARWRCSIWRGILIHQDHVELILLGVVQHVVQQGVVVEHLRHVEAVQQQVGDAEHVGELLLLDAVDGIPVFLRVRRVLDLLLQLAKPAGDEAARAAGKVYYGGVFDTARYECKYKNIPISKDFRDIKSSRKPYLIGRCVIAGMIHA